MDLSGIIAISGKPGLFKVIAQGKNNIIVQSLVDNKKMPAYASDRISALEDISIYTYDEDAPLKEVFVSIHKKENGKECPSHKDAYDTLFAYLLEIIPNFDQERVYPSDVKKIFQWYNLLLKAGLLTVTEEPVEVEVIPSDSKKKEKAVKTDKAPAKKAAAKPKAEPAAKSAKPTTAKKTAAVKTGTSRGK